MKALLRRAFYIIDMSTKKFKEPHALNAVAAFHQTFKLPVLDAPHIPDASRCQLRINLLQEELNELKQAIEDHNIVEVADALCDLQYVLSGAILEFGLGEKFKALFDEVQRSNMSKVSPDLATAEQTLEFYKQKDGTQGYVQESEEGFLVYRDHDNKVLKSISYSPADLEGILTQ